MNEDYFDVKCLSLFSGFPINAFKELVSEGYLKREASNGTIVTKPEQKNESFIIFKDKNEEVIVNIKSCMMDSDIEKCYEIANVNVKDLDVQSIKTSLN